MEYLTIIQLIHEAEITVGIVAAILLKMLWNSLPTLIPSLKPSRTILWREDPENAETTCDVTNKKSDQRLAKKHSCKMVLDFADLGNLP
jgi:hypothetical protein